MSNGEITKKIGRRIRGVRNKAGLSQENLAVRAGTTKNYLGNLERGQIDNIGLEIIANICKALGITLSELFQDVEESRTTAEDDDTFANALYSQMIEKACYPPSVEGMPVSTLLQFLVYLPLIQPELLLDSLARMDGSFVGSESYILKQINTCIKRIPASPAREYADECIRDLENRNARPNEEEDNQSLAQSDANYKQYIARIKQMETLIGCYRALKDIEI